ncbi:MAG: hypothetical protein OEY14_08060 [Myxococcales bacterium]|nr:hypothetical protein [Myxococcales bacterium]
MIRRLSIASIGLFFSLSLTLSASLSAQPAPLEAVLFDAFDASGGVPERVLRRVLESAREDVGRCFGAARERVAGLGGASARIRLLIASDGEVVAVALEESSLSDPAFLGCVQARLRRLRFRAQATLTTATVRMRIGEARGRPIPAARSLRRPGGEAPPQASPSRLGPSLEPPGTLRLRHREPVVRGALAHELVAGILQDAGRRFRFCFEEAGDLEERARFPLEFAIDASGRVEAIRFPTEGQADSELAHCLRAQLRRLRFPPSAEGRTQVAYSLWAESSPSGRP